MPPGAGPTQIGQVDGAGALQQDERDRRPDEQDQRHHQIGLHLRPWRGRGQATGSPGADRCRAGVGPPWSPPAPRRDLGADGEVGDPAGQVVCIAAREEEPVGPKRGPDGDDGAGLGVGERPSRGAGIDDRHLAVGRSIGSDCAGGRPTTPESPLRPIVRPRGPRPMTRAGPGAGHRALG